jgi:beta-galactosidase GanA
MIDPFTLSSIVLSFALHIGHIGYTIYQNAPAIKAEIEKDVVIENHTIENHTIENHTEDVEKLENEFQKTVELIESANALLLINKKEIHLTIDIPQKQYDDTIFLSSN